LYDSGFIWRFGGGLNLKGSRRARAADLHAGRGRSFKDDASGAPNGTAQRGQAPLRWSEAARRM